jgi:glycosyltransferase involved in cell wall biosynthesis
MARKHRRAFFYVNVKDPSLLNLVEFYHDDIRILEELGFEVTTATRPRQLRTGFDLYFYWWWGKGSLVIPFAFLSGAPVVSTGTMDDVPSMKLGFGNLPRWKQSVIRFGISYSTAQLAISQLELDALRRHQASRPRLVPCAIDTRLYCPLTLPSKAACPTICTVSHLNSHNILRKGILRLLEVASVLQRDFPRLRIIIAGTPGDGYELLTDKVNKLGLHDIVALPGRISTEEKINLYRESWIYAQLSDHEGFGLAAGEAMSCGTPVVGCRAGALGELIGDGGIILDQYNLEQTAAAMTGILRDRVAREECGQKARSRIVSCYSYETRRGAVRDVLLEIGVL